MNRFLYGYLGMYERSVEAIRQPYFPREKSLPSLRTIATAIGAYWRKRG
jgi:hypothetical protein